MPLWVEVTYSFTLAVPFQILEGCYFNESTQCSKPTTGRKKQHNGKARLCYRGMYFHEWKSLLCPKVYLTVGWSSM